MTFVTYENHRNPHVTIHYPNCGHLRKHGGEHRYGQGGYKEHFTFAGAQHYARQTGLPASECSSCNPVALPVGATYALTWNPELWPWVDLPLAADMVSQGAVYREDWSMGNTKSIEPGSTFILLRVGKKPLGMMGAGRIISTAVYTKPHFDGSGRPQNAVDVEFDWLVHPPLEANGFIPRSELLELDDHFVSLQASGTRVPDAAAAKILDRIHMEASHGDALFGNEPSQRPVVEGRLVRISVNRYERSPALRDACIAHYGARCQVCGFDFGAFYGPDAQGLIEVHHLERLADGGERVVDPIGDLRPLCANCHRVIHWTEPPLKIEALRERIRAPWPPERVGDIAG